MSWQQVNLYRPDLRPKKEILDAKQALFAFAVFAVLLVLTTILDAVGNTNLKRQIASLDTQIESLSQDIAVVQAQLPRSQAAAIQSEIDALRLEHERRLRIYSLIHQQNLGNSEGFSSQMIALAQQHQPAISLSLITLKNGGKQVNMTGVARVPEAIPQYLQRLQGDPAFNGVAFGSLVLDRNSSERISFSFSHDSLLTSGLQK